MKQDLANTIHLAVLAFFQNRRGFNEWWHSMDSNTQAAIELNLIDCIDRRLNKPLQPNLILCDKCEHQMDVVAYCKLCSNSKKVG